MRMQKHYEMFSCGNATSCMSVKVLEVTFGIAKNET